MPCGSGESQPQTRRGRHESGVQLRRDGACLVTRVSISGDVHRLLPGRIYSSSAHTIRSEEINLGARLVYHMLRPQQVVMRRVTTFGAGLLVGTALTVIIPEGVESLFEGVCFNLLCLVILFSACPIVSLAHKPAECS